MRVGHSILVTGRCGLYNSARTLVSAERDAGVDAWFIPIMGFEEPEIDGIPCSLKLEKCNVLVSHSGLSPAQTQSGLPMVHIFHAQPRYKLISETRKDGTGPFYSVLKSLRSKMAPIEFVTFYPEHLPYWQLALPDSPIHVIPPPLDLEMWTPSGNSEYDFGGKIGRINVVAADTWRSTQDPYDIVHAVAIFAKRHHGVKLHIYGVGELQERLSPAWTGVMHILESMGVLGELMSWSNQMGDVYRAADMILSNQISANNVMREAMACGCPVVADHGCVHTPWVADIRDPSAYADAMERAYHSQMHFDPRTYAEEHFDGKKSAAALIEVIKGIYNGESFTVTSPSRSWHEEGLRFECQKGCTACCRCGDGIPVLEEEIQAIAAMLGADTSPWDWFRQTENGWVIDFDDEGKCPFVTDAGCYVQNAKPAACAAYPFWPENVMSEARWLELAKTCPGAGQGKIVCHDEIEKQQHNYTMVKLHSLGERLPKENP